MLVPTLVSGLKGHHVIDVACGSGDAQTLAVTKDGKLSSTCQRYRQQFPYFEATVCWQKKR